MLRLKSVFQKKIKSEIVEVLMNLDQGTFHMEKAQQLNSKQVIFKIKPDMKEQEKLFGSSLYKLPIAAEVNNIPLDSLIIIDGENFISTISNEEIPK